MPLSYHPVARFSKKKKKYSCVCVCLFNNWPLRIPPFFYYHLHTYQYIKKVRFNTSKKERRVDIQFRSQSKRQFIPHSHPLFVLESLSQWKKKLCFTTLQMKNYYPSVTQTIYQLSIIIIITTMIIILNNDWSITLVLLCDDKTQYSQKLACLFCLFSTFSL